jgi:hypothetical protein
MHAGATPHRRPRTGVSAPRSSGIGLGEPGASAAADGDETFREPPAPRTWRSIVLDRLGASLAELAHGVGGRPAGRRCRGGIATGSAGDGPDVPNADRAAVHLWINRSACSSVTWRTANPLWGAPRFMANSARSVSTSRNARCRVCWDGPHVRLLQTWTGRGCGRSHWLGGRPVRMRTR